MNISSHFIKNYRLQFMRLALVFLTSSSAQADDEGVKQFKANSPSSNLSINFERVNVLLDSSVLDMGLSKRKRMHSELAITGTRAKQSVNRKTDLEGNKFAFELFEDDAERKKIEGIKNHLESLASTSPLHLYNKNEQLAYWLNLYNVTLLNEIANVYPKRVLKSFSTGDSSIFNKKNMTVAGTNLSLNDIQYKILKVNYDSDPLILYGLYQGIIGGPDIRKEAYQGRKVYKQLEKNAIAFVNSNRGTNVNAKFNKVNASYFYSHNAAYFPIFNEDLRKHLLLYANNNIYSHIVNVDEINPTITNWKVTDMYGTIRTMGGGSMVSAQDGSDSPTYSPSQPGKFSAMQIVRLKELMRIRAINYGGTSVTVTDLDSEETNEGG